MNQQLTKSDVEWLRCLTISKRLTPVLPDDVLKKFEAEQLVAGDGDTKIVTISGYEILSRRCPASPDLRP
jgi:hypothetical protein